MQRGSEGFRAFHDGHPGIAILIPNRQVHSEKKTNSRVFSYLGFQPGKPGGELAAPFPDWPGGPGGRFQDWDSHDQRSIRLPQVDEDTVPGRFTQLLETVLDLGPQPDGLVWGDFLVVPGNRAGGSEKPESGRQNDNVQVVG